MNTISNCSLIELKKISSGAGSITPVYNEDLPFDIQSVFYIYDIASGESRGAHAHLSCHQFIVAISGCFDILLDDGQTKRTVQLKLPNYGLYIPPGIWASEVNFSSGAICLVLASHKFEEEDYIRDYEKFIKYRTEL